MHEQVLISRVLLRVASPPWVDTPTVVMGTLLEEGSQVAGAPWRGSQLFSGGGTCSLLQALGGSLRHKMEGHPGCASQ